MILDSKGGFMNILHVNLSTSGWQPPLLTGNSAIFDANRRSWLPRRKRSRALAAVIVLSYIFLGRLAWRSMDGSSDMFQAMSSLASAPASYAWTGFHRAAH